MYIKFIRLSQLIDIKQNIINFFYINKLGKKNKIFIYFLKIKNKNK